MINAYEFFKLNAAMLCICLMLVASLQPVFAENVLPPLTILHETEVVLLNDSEDPEQQTRVLGTVHSGGPFSLRTFQLQVPGDNGPEHMTATYAWSEAGQGIHVTITVDEEVYDFINFLDNQAAVDDFLVRYLPMYFRHYGMGPGAGTRAEPEILPVKETSMKQRMIHFFAWLDQHFLDTEDVDYGFSDQFAWMTSEAYARFIPGAADALYYVAYAPESVIDNGYVKTLTYQDLVTVFSYPIQRVIEEEMPMPSRHEQESFGVSFVPMELNQPPGGGGGDWGFNNYIDCWNETETSSECRSCCGDWYAAATAICILVAILNPIAGLACEAAASVGYLYCRLGCGLANPGGGGGG